MNKSRMQIIEAFLNERKKAEFELKQKEKALYQRYPELAQLEDRFKTAGITFTKNRIKGNDRAKQIYDAEINAINEEKHQLYEKYHIPCDYLNPVYQCEICRDTGYVDGKCCQCLKNRIDEVCFSQYDLKPAAQKDTFDRFDLALYPEEHYQYYQKIIKLCKEFCNNFNDAVQNYYFYGMPGLGKTFLCNCIVNELIASDHNIIYITVSHLLESIKDNLYSENDDNNIVDSVKSCELLIIDDLGTEYSTEYNAALLFDIINDRLSANKPMIISSNLTPQDINARYSPRLYSRICGNFRLIHFKGEDIRFIKKRRQR